MIINPATDRECSFIQGPSLDHSVFGNEDNKNGDLIMCISNLDIKDIDNPFPEYAANNSGPEMNTDSVFMDRINLSFSANSTADNSNNLKRIDKDKVHLIKSQKTENIENGKGNKKSKRNLIITLSVILLLSIVGVSIYFICK